jgi:molecular chaperone GrpE
LPGICLATPPVASDLLRAAFTPPGARDLFLESDLTISVTGMSDRTDEQPASGTTGTGAESADDGEAGASRDAESAPSGEAPAGGAEAAASELQSTRDRYLRLAAEYDNYRKRTEKERSESFSRAQAQLVQQLLDPLDDLQRVSHVNPETTSVQSLLDGVQMVERKLARALEAAGLEIMDASGRPFDPSVHEAIVTTPAESREDDDSVGEVFQKGYRFKGDLLRPARVQVRKYGG